MGKRTVASLLTSTEVAELAGPRSYARGSGYQRDGRVELNVAGDTRVEAIVRGTLPYRVALWVDRTKLNWSCSCPMGDDGGFCKHCVAVALTIHRDEPPAEAVPRPTATTRRVEADLRAFVETLDATEVVDLLMDQADADWRLRERLAARASAARGDALDEQVWRRRLDVAFAPDDEFVDYQDAPSCATDVSEVIDALEELVDTGHANAVIGLAEYAHGLADSAMQYIDDSDGWLGDMSSRLGSLHLRACAEGSPDRIELARRLANLELTSELDAFHRAAARYADVLGDDGVAEYRRIIEPKWRKLGPATDRWSSERFRIQEAMTGVALAVDDPDELVRVKQRDLRTPDDYCEIAVSLRSAGRVDDAVDWARRGLDAHASRSWQTPPLRELLAEMLRDDGDLDAAVTMFWQAFEHHPTIETYRRLLTEVERTGNRGDWQQRAIASLRTRVAERRPDDATAPSIVSVPPSVALVEILLYEGDIDGAWEAATTHGCTDPLWLTLARAREDNHPLDAIPIYERDALAQIDTKKNQGYRNAVKHLARIRALAARAGDPGRFERLLADVRTRHKPKRNLMALLDARGW